MPKAASAPKTSLEQSFVGANMAAEKQAKLNAAKLVTAVDNETRANIRNVVTRSIRDGLTPYDTAKMLKGMIGLNVQQGQAVMNYRAGLVEAGTSKAQLDAAVSKYADAQLSSRAETIARTEIMDSLNEGMVASWQEAQSDGLISKDAEKEWSATDDACDDCAELDGETVGLNDDFPDGDPPAHPRCRCSLLINP